MKIIKYKFLSAEINHGTEEEPNIEQVLIGVEVGWNEVNEEIAKKEAYNGEYTIEDDGISSYPIAPRNILKGEYITINNIMYKAIENIPNGEAVIENKNVIIVNIEQVLYELNRGNN
jgi:hypothetical protein